MKLEPGDFVSVRGIMTGLPLVERDGELVAEGPHGGTYMIVETDRGWRAVTPPPGLADLPVERVRTGSGTIPGP